MSLKQVTSGIFPYLEKALVREDFSSSITYEFDRSVFVHGLSVVATNDIVIVLTVVYPVSFSSPAESFPVQIANVSMSAGSVYFSPFAVTVNPAGVAAPLPSALPKGTRLIVNLSTALPTNVEVQTFLIASGEF